MEEIHYLELDFDLDLIDPLQELVKSKSPFVIAPSNIDSPYEIFEYTRASKFQNVKLMSLVDNNILTRASAIAKGERISGNSESMSVDRLACAVMCYFILGEFTIEPSISIYEKSSKSSHDEAVSELFHFKVADHIHPQVYAELALGIRDRAYPVEIETAINYVNQKPLEYRETNFSKTLDSWKISYLFVLKAAELWKDGGDKVDAAKKYIKWMEKDSFFNAISSLFALLFLSPSRITRMVKGIESKDIRKFSDGLKSCAWDLAYITKWKDLVADSRTDTIWFLCTNDNVMKQIANTVFHPPGSVTDDAVRELFCSYWGDRDGSCLYGSYIESVNAIEINDENRDIRVHKRFHEVDGMVSELEAKLGIKT